MPKANKALISRRLHEVRLLLEEQRQIIHDTEDLLAAQKKAARDYGIEIEWLARQ